MDLAYQQIVNGLIVGSTYAIVALGFGLVQSVMRVVNMAHPDIAMLGAYSTYLLTDALVPGDHALGIGAGLAVLALLFAAGGAVGGAAGLVLERVVIRPCRGKPMLISFIATAGIGIAIENVVNGKYGSNPVPVRSVLATKSLTVFGAQITQMQLATVLISVIMAAGVSYYVRRTNWGLATRAIADRWDVTSACGVNVNAVSRLTMAIASGLAGVAGVTIALTQASANPFMGLVLGLKSFICMFVAGDRHIEGILAIGLLLGISESMITGYVSSQYKDVISFGTMLVVLAIKPNGLFGSYAREKLIVLPNLVFISPYWTAVAINAVVLAITVTGLYISNSAGTLSVGHAALAGAGGYAGAVLTTNFGWPFLPAVLVGAVVGSVLGLVLALLTVRMSLLVAGLCTLAFGQMLVVISYNIKYIGGGSSFYGIPPFTTLAIALLGLAIALYLAWGFDRSRLGNSALAIRDDALAASAIGIHVNYVKIVVFAVGAAITGSGGVLRVHYVLVQRPDDLSFFVSLPLVIMWVIGGSYTFYGPAVGAVLLTFLPELLRFSTTGRLVMYGLLLAVFVITRPQGIVPRHVLQNLANTYKRWRGHSDESALAAAGSPDN